MDNIVYIGIIVIVILIIFVLFFFRQQNMIQKILIDQQNQKNEETQQVYKNVRSELEILNQSLKTDFNRLNETTVDRLLKIEGRVNEGLIKGFEATNKSFNTMKEELVKIGETQENLKSLSTNITDLQNVLMDKKSRGTFGEVELYSILESVFGNNQKRYQKQYKLENGNIADAVLFAKEPLGNIVIDSKFPLENYIKMHSDDLSSDEQNKAKQTFRKDVLKHINDIKIRYLQSYEVADFAYMFIPAEAIFAEIYGKFEDIIQASYQAKVYLVSPTTLMAYITAIRAIYLGQQRDEQVVEIQKEFGKLSKEFERFESRFSTVVNDFEKTYKDINQVNITSSKIINRFKQIESVELEHKENLINESHDKEI